MKKQHGLVLVFALLVLVSITVLGISSVSSSALQTKMASSIEKTSLIFDAAEAAIGGVVFESEDEALLSDPNALDPLSEARQAAVFDLDNEQLSCFDDRRTRRNATMAGMAFNTRHTQAGKFSNVPPMNAWSRSVFIREQACVGSSNVIGGSNISCHVFLIRGCGQIEGSDFAVANTLTASVFAPSSTNR